MIENEIWNDDDRHDGRMIHSLDLDWLIEWSDWMNESWMIDRTIQFYF